MKIIAILMVIALVASVFGVGYLYMTASVVVTAVGMTATEASVQQATFDKLKTDVAQSSLVGTLFQSGRGAGGGGGVSVLYLYGAAS